MFKTQAKIAGRRSRLKMAKRALSIMHAWRGHLGQRDDGQHPIDVLREHPMHAIGAAHQYVGTGHAGLPRTQYAGNSGGGNGQQHRQ